MANNMVQKINDISRKVMEIPLDFQGGIHSLRSWKFYAVFVLYFAATSLFMSDSFFGITRFEYHQGVVPSLVALIIVSALAWEMILLGPVNGCNLVLQVFLVVPVSLLIARLFGAPSEVVASTNDATFLSGIWTQLSQFSRDFGLQQLITKFFTLIPVFIRDVFAHPMTSFILIFTLLSLCFKNEKVRIGLILTLIVLGTLFSLTESFSFFFVGAWVCLFLGISFQYCHYQKIMMYKNILAQIISGPSVDRLEFRVMMRVVTFALVQGRVSESTVHAIVKSEYNALHDYKTTETRIIAGEITRKLVYEYAALELRGDNQGVSLTLNDRLSHYTTFLAGVSVYPRLLFAFAIAFFWAIMPLDLVPDAIPCLGMLDDMVVTILATFVFRSSIPRITE